jgi:predicted ATPase
VDDSHIYWGDYAEAKAGADELAALGDQKDASFWKQGAMINQGWVLTLSGQPEAAIRTITAGMKMWRQNSSSVNFPLFLPYLAIAYLDVGQVDDAWRCIHKALTAVETTKEQWCEAEVHRIAGKIALSGPPPDAAETEAYFQRALSVACHQKAKCWELRASMSLARLWRDQGKVQQARELLAPVYGWFTEGFDTRDLKEAKALLDELA